jgi:hypothetical protein
MANANEMTVLLVSRDLFIRTREIRNLQGRLSFTPMIVARMLSRR